MTDEMLEKYRAALTVGRPITALPGPALDLVREIDRLRAELAAAEAVAADLIEEGGEIWWEVHITDSVLGPLQKPRRYDTERAALEAAARLSPSKHHVVSVWRIRALLVRGGPQRQQTDTGAEG